MGKDNFCVLGANITIPLDMVKYIDTLHRFQCKKNQVIEKLRSLEIQETPDQEICEDIRVEAVGIVNEIIQELSTYGIYNKVVSDFIPAQYYEKILETNQENIDNAIAEASDEYWCALETAREEAGNSVSGLPFGIISNSLIGAGMYALQERAEVKKQLAKANAEYVQCSLHLENTYNIMVETAKKGGHEQLVSHLEVATGELLDHIAALYLTELSSCGQFDISCLNGISIERSSELLNKLKFINDKCNVIKQALSLCPFNPLIYIHASEVNLLSPDLVNLGKHLHIQEDIVHAAESFSGLREEQHLDPTQVIHRFKNPCMAISCFTGETLPDVMLRYFPGLKDSVLAPFKDLANVIFCLGCNGIVDTAKKDKLLHYAEKHSEAVNQYRTTRDCLQFVQDCTYTPAEISLFFTVFGKQETEVTIAEVVGYTDEPVYDGIVQHISDSIEPFMADILTAINEQKEKTEKVQAEEKQRKEHEKQKADKQKKLSDTLALVCIGCFVSFILFMILGCFWLPFTVVGFVCLLIFIGVLIYMKFFDPYGF